jgi:tetratricopeptide (TPR) repeat protein
MANGELESAQKELHRDVKEQIHVASLALAELTVEDEAHKEGLIPQISKEAALETEMMKELSQFQKKIEDGVLQLLKTMSELAAHEPSFLSDEVARELAGVVAFSKNLKENLETYFEEFAQDTPLQQICGLSDETLQLLYRAAKYIYDGAHYKEAAEAFAFLTLLNPNFPIFWYALGESEYRLHKYESALYALAFAAQNDPEDPYCHLTSSRCYEAIKEYDNAVNALELALVAISERQEFVELKSFIQSEKVRLSGKI